MRKHDSIAVSPGHFRRKHAAWTRLPVFAALIAALCSLLLAPALSKAAPGDLDPSFGTGGKLTVDFGGHDIVNDVAVQADDKLVAVGRIGFDFLVTRVTADGMLDTSFGDAGKVVIPRPREVFQITSDATAVAVQQDGKIVAVGFANFVHCPGIFDNDFRIIRLNPDGSRDDSFGVNGEVATNFGGEICGFRRGDAAHDVAIQQDGKIVVVGTSTFDIALARYHPDGSLDTTFGTNGKVLTDTSGNEAGETVALQSDGKIVVGGHARLGGVFAFRAVRYHPDGSVDTSFGNNGVAATSMGTGDHGVHDMVVQPDGKIVLAGTVAITNGAQASFAMVRYLSDGTLDPSFGAGGVVVSDLFASDERAFAMALQANGKIVLGGQVAIPPDIYGKFGVARYHADGSLDTGFGSNGAVITPFSENRDRVTGLVIQSTGKIVAAGTSSMISNNDIAMARYAGDVINQPPVANAGMDATAHIGDQVTLDGSGSSDPDGDAISYAWTIVDRPIGSTAALDDPGAVMPTFTPDAVGAYTIELMVTDSFGASSAPDSVLVSTFNTPPVADAGPNQAIVRINTVVTLDGTQSYDPDGDAISYSWTIVQKPAGSLAALDNPASATPSFVADVHGAVPYEIRLVVTDQFGAASDPDSVVVSFDNVAPVADAGSNQMVLVGDTVLLNGANSSDANGDPLTYYWSLVSTPSGSVAALSDPNAVDPQFLADRAGTYVASLVVNDGFLNSAPSNVTVTAITVQDALTQKLGELMDAINELPDEAFKNKNMRNALTNKVSAVLLQVEQGNYAGALNKLVNDLLGKTNGCAAGGTPDANDWITTCPAQGPIHDCILQVIALLQEVQ